MRAQYIKFSYMGMLGIFALLCVVFTNCSNEVHTPSDIEYDYSKVPAHFPPIPFPENNPYSLDKVKLGRMLFYEPLLTEKMDMPSCSHCMQHQKAFTDDRRFSLGNNQEPQWRNTMSPVNAAYRTKYFWDGRGNAIEGPAYRSLFLPDIFGADTNEVQARLERHPIYPEMFRKAFGENAKPTAYKIGQAISTFIRTMVSGNSKYDRYLLGDENALNEQEKRGMELFFSEKTSCSVCHSGLLFTNEDFHNTGVVAHYFDRGRYFVSKNFDDNGKFLTPTLRNVEVTAPYMHSAMFWTLEEVIEHYNSGGRTFINKDPLIRPLHLTFQERQDLVAFLKTLTDWEFLNNPFYSNPFK